MRTRIAPTISRMRKVPRQERSRETTEVILQAAAHVLSAKGWAGFTTNEIAAVAGVSIGSLYQYFPNKLSIVESIRRQHYDDVLEALRAATASGRPRAARVAALVDGMIAAHGRRPASHRVLIEEAPTSEDAAGAHAAFEAEYWRRFEDLVRDGAEADPAMSIAAQTLSAAVAGAIHDAAARGSLHSEAFRGITIAMVSDMIRFSRRRRLDPAPARPASHQGT